MMNQFAYWKCWHGLNTQLNGLKNEMFSESDSDCLNDEWFI